MKAWALLVGLVMCLVVIGFGPEKRVGAQTSTGASTRVSVDSSGAQGDRESARPSISADGRYVAFDSYASNLVPGDTNGDCNGCGEDVFVHDRQTGETTRISVDSSGVQGNGRSSFPAISADGRYVAFDSYASNLVPGGTNGAYHIFVHDQQTGTTTQVSVDSAGVQGIQDSSSPTISADGRCVAFESDASNLVPGDTNGETDIFVHDRQTGTTTRVSVDSSGAQGSSDSRYPSISADGRYVAFESDASTLVPSDTNEGKDIFIHDRQTGATTRVSVDSSGAQAEGKAYNSSISADGRYVAFESDASNLVPGDTNAFWDIFVHDRQTGTTTRVSIDSSGAQGKGESYGPVISADGRYVAFKSMANNLVPSDSYSYSGIYIHDRQTGATTRVSIDSSGAQGKGESFDPSISADGRFVAFMSEAANLVTDDTNDVMDIFVHDRGHGDSIPLPESTNIAVDVTQSAPAIGDGETPPADDSTTVPEPIMVTEPDSTIAPSRAVSSSGSEGILLGIIVVLAAALLFLIIGNLTRRR